MMSAVPFIYQAPKLPLLPILVSVPHCGVQFPKDIHSDFSDEILKNPPDTDWLVDELYSFVLSLGVGILKAKYSRYVVDLNRDPEDRPLYNDSRPQFSLFPLQTFMGEKIYRDPDFILTTEIKQSRKKIYYDPYHAELERRILELQKSFKHILIIEAHSIKRLVPSIQRTPFPDLIIGTNEGKSAHPLLESNIINNLRSDGSFQFSLNEPFRGGYITRHYARPDVGVHFIQIEMSQDLYLDEFNKVDAQKSGRFESVMKLILLELAKVLKQL
ncbi:MAG: N-formylglutamate amidohydrolase [Oligoflexales bacterium]|nr:N-formylglutamate amidohydrolase [Oligoflexales bacterium]